MTLKPTTLDQPQRRLLFAHRLDSDESSDLEVKEDVKDTIGSMRKERAEVKAQYGKDKFRAR
jgi:hypothetical protein